MRSPRAENPEAQRHYELARPRVSRNSASTSRPGFPGRRRGDADPEWFQKLQFSVPGMGLEEWELLLGVNAMQDPMGQALADALVLGSGTLGYHQRGEAVPGERRFRSA